MARGSGKTAANPPAPYNHQALTEYLSSKCNPVVLTPSELNKCYRITLPNWAAGPGQRTEQVRRHKNLVEAIARKHHVEFDRTRKSLIDEAVDQFVAASEPQPPSPDMFGLGGGRGGEVDTNSGEEDSVGGDVAGAGAGHSEAASDYGSGMDVDGGAAGSAAAAAAEDLRALNEYRDQLDVARAALNQERQAWERAHAARQAQAQKLDDHVAQRRADMERLQVQLQELDQEVSHKQTNAEKLQQDVSTKHRRVIDLDKDIAIKTRRAQEWDKVIADKNSDYEQLQQKMEAAVNKKSEYELDKDIASKRRRAQELDKVIADKISDYELLQQKMKTAAKNSDYEHDKDIASKRRRAQELDKIISDRKSDHEQLQKKVAEYKAHIEQLQVKIREEASKLQQLEQDAGDKERQVQELQETMTQTKLNNQHTNADDDGRRSTLPPTFLPPALQVRLDRIRSSPSSSSLRLKRVLHRQIKDHAKTLDHHHVEQLLESIGKKVEVGSLIPALQDLRQTVVCVSKGLEDL